MQAEECALICDWFFSDKPIHKYSKSDQRVLRLAQDILSMHGVNGKFVECLIRHKFNIKEPVGIHGWDGYVGNKPVEIKTETVNDSARLSAMGSFASNRENSSMFTGDIFLKERPIYINVGLNLSGKCLYVLFTDTSKLPDNTPLFKELNKGGPRIRWCHYRDHRKAASKLMFFSKYEVECYESSFTKEFLKDLREMM